jgi:hypothetical protein
MGIFTGTWGEKRWHMGRNREQIASQKRRSRGRERSRERVSIAAAAVTSIKMVEGR